MNFNSNLFIILISLFLLSCGNEDSQNTKNYESQKENLQLAEQTNSLAFLSVSGENKKNLIGQTVITGSIRNKATFTTYENVRVKMLCFADNSMIEEHEDVITGAIEPGGIKDYKVKYRLPKETDSINLSIMRATVKEN